MSFVYFAETNQGDYDVTVEKHHDHMSKADFERQLTQALLSLGTGVVLHHYTFKGRR